MSQDQDGFDLVRSLELFLQEVEGYAPVEVIRSFRLQLPVTDPAWIKALVLALREGLTNGIRHGQAGRFEFSLEQVEGELRFTLWNSGIPYDGRPAGFGLASMEERVRQLGGILSLKGDSSRGGSVLSIRIPKEGGS
ncbi:sensory histidine kinase UhpB [compost metagenome]